MFVKASKLVFLVAGAALALPVLASASGAASPAGIQDRGGDGSGQQAGQQGGQRQGATKKARKQGQAQRAGDKAGQKARGQGAQGQGARQGDRPVRAGGGDLSSQKGRAAQIREAQSERQRALDHLSQQYRVHQDKLARLDAQAQALRAEGKADELRRVEQARAAEIERFGQTTANLRSQLGDEAYQDAVARLRRGESITSASDPGVADGRGGDGPGPNARRVAEMREAQKQRERVENIREAQGQRERVGEIREGQQQRAGGSGGGDGESQLSDRQRQASVEVTRLFGDHQATLKRLDAQADELRAQGDAEGLRRVEAARSAEVQRFREATASQREALGEREFATLLDRLREVTPPTGGTPPRGGR